MLSQLEQVIIGLLQGVFEWLPVSSKTVVMLFSMLIAGRLPAESYAVGLAVQGGTVAAAIAYFRKEIANAILGKDRRLLLFVFLATLTTLLTAAPTYILTTRLLITGATVGYITLSVGAVLIAQATVLAKLKSGRKGVSSASLMDAVITGFFQGLSVAPGVSRSGTTLIALLLLKYELGEALKISFILSIPVNLGATIFAVVLGNGLAETLDFGGFIVSLATSALAGFATIKYLISLAARYGHKLAYLLGLVTLTIGLFMVML